MAALPSVLCCRCGDPGAENEDSKRNFERPTPLAAVLVPRPEPRMIVPRFEPDDIGVAARLLAASNGPGEWRGVADGDAGCGWSFGRTDMIPTRKSLVSTRYQVVKAPKTTRSSEGHGQDSSKQEWIQIFSISPSTISVY